METPRAGRLVTVFVALVVFVLFFAACLVAFFAMCALGKEELHRDSTSRPATFTRSVHRKSTRPRVAENTHAAENYSRRAEMSAKGPHRQTRRSGSTLSNRPTRPDTGTAHRKDLSRKAAMSAKGFVGPALFCSAGL